MPNPIPAPLRGLARATTPRRAVAAALALVAALLALGSATGDGDAVPVLVTARALAGGATLTPADVRTVRVPRALAPESALATPDAADGAVLTGAAAAGEAITSTRVVGPESTRLAIGADGAAVPIRLADAATGGLLRAGTRVDVVAADEHGGAAVLARDAVVLAVRPDDPARAGPREGVALIALPREAATRVAAASLGQPVAVTLR